MDQLKAPFPWFGGKSRVAHIVWQRFGDVANYVEPFFGSGAVLFGRPHKPRIETVNDKDAFVANFWRAVKHDPDAVARWCDWPVNECDLHARHRWLVETMPAHRERLEIEPDYYNAKIAGWWVWAICSSIANGCKKPDIDGKGGKGVAGVDWPGHFIHLTDRFRRVRVTCGDWATLTSNSALATNHVKTAMFLDPPYSHAEHDGARYGESDIAADVAAWARAHGDNPNLRIALCGYEGEHEMPGWDCVAWKAGGGYGNRNKDNKNPWRERIWFSPYCLKGQLTLFD